ncbi:hypothetical protein SAMN04488103_1023 [Gemmobacter aquatilis]|uniref:Uncharacterized protein n=1 Tax=Gemmobacter aquatilis TaxID=933059 RepID=A0A1H8B185_9RHOB|nr:hypothetical protein [Gemmobacter aquatilis]SEM75999.1 hypothetical protein SAMN04488103_1023 [Gemmobacter aquatilis]
MTVSYLRLVTVDGVRIGPDYSELDLFAQEQARASARFHREEAAHERRFWFNMRAALPHCAEADLMLASVEYGVAMHLRAAELFDRIHKADQFTKEVCEQKANLSEKAAQAFTQAGDLMMQIAPRVA